MNSANVTGRWMTAIDQEADKAFWALKRQSLKQMQRRLIWWRLAIALRRTLPWAVLIVTLSAIVGVAVLTLEKLNH